MSFPSWSCGFASETVTRAPRPCKKRAEATPDLPRPITSTRLLARSKGLPFHHRGTGENRIKENSNGHSTEWLRDTNEVPFWPGFGASLARLSQLQRRQSEQGEHQGCDPEAYDDF